MKQYAFSTAALFPRDSADALEMIGKAGFKYAELMPQCFADNSGYFIEKALRTGVKVSSIHFPLAMFSMLYNAHPGMAAEVHDFGSKLVGMAKQLGTKVIVIHPHNHADVRYKSLLENPITNNIKNLADLCFDNGIVLAVENNPKSPGATPEGLLEYVNGFCHRAMAPMVDTTEAFEAGIDPAVFIGKVKPVHMHLSDYAGETKHIPAGQGSMDWGSIARALKDYTGFLTLEPSYKYYIDNAEAMLYDARKFMDDIFGSGF